MKSYKIGFLDKMWGCIGLQYNDYKELLADKLIYWRLHEIASQTLGMQEKILFSILLECPNTIEDATIMYNDLCCDRKKDYVEKESIRTMANRARTKVAVIASKDHFINSRLVYILCRNDDREKRAKI